MAQRLDKLRARSASDKELRRAALLDAARRLLRRVPWSELTVAEVARAAGLAKGSVFRYFPSKEALVLAVFELELAELFAALHARLGVGRRFDAQTFVHALLAELAERPVYLHLATVVHGVLEHNLVLDECVRFKHALLAHLTAGGALLEQGLGGVRPGEGLRLLLRVHALIIGFWQLTDHPPVVAAAIAHPGLEAFRIDFADELGTVLVTLLRGMKERS
jgi:TetR/AcrR family transcriptional regulator